MDEIFILATLKGGQVQIFQRCSDKKCLAMHFYTGIEDVSVGKVVVDALNASSYARLVSERLSA